MVSIFAFTLIVTINFGIGWKIVTAFDRRKELSLFESLIVAYLVGTYFIYFSVFFIGQWRLDILTMSALTFIGLLMSFYCLKSFPWRTLCSGISAIRNESGWTSFLCLAAAALALVNLLQGLAPPNDYDSLMYHLSIPQFDFEKGHITVPADTRAMHALFPAMTSNMSRYMLTIGTAQSAQLAHGMLGVVAGLGAAALVRRMGYPLWVTIIGAILFLSVRAVVWQMGSAETDVPLAAYFIGATLLYVVWRSSPGPGLQILFGLMIGAAILTKYIGFALALSFAAIMLHDLFRKPKALSSLFVGPAVSFLVLVPHLIRNFTETGNPLFPVFNKLFNPGLVDPYGSIADLMGTGRGILDLAIAPWMISIFPMHFYDGMVLGAPLFLALCPLILLQPAHVKKWILVISIPFIFYLFWFWGLSQQVRFLIPILPIIAAVGAVGGFVLWKNVYGIMVLRSAAILIFGILFLNQSMFVGIYAALRLPVSVNLVSEPAYHASTPTMDGSYFTTCSFLKNNLKDGEIYFSALRFPSFYCPQASMHNARLPDEGPWIEDPQNGPKELGFDEFVESVKRADFRYYIVQTDSRNRGRTATTFKAEKNVTASTITIPAKDVSWRFSRFLLPAFEGLKPVSRDKNSAVYDGTQVLDRLQKIGASRDHSR